MNFTELLLTVEDHIMFDRRGLVVLPPVELTADRQNFKPFTSKVLVQRPDQAEQVHTISFQLEHLSLTGGGSKWDIAVVFPDGTKESVPIGSRLHVTIEAMQKLKGQPPAR